MKTLIAFLLLVSAFSSGAQPLPRQIVVEHFTNTWCSICGSRNPGLFTNLAQSPDVMHLAIYPSAPYKGCPLSHYAPADQDARTNYYGIYGGTPRLVIGGKVLEASENYSGAAIFAGERGQFSSFGLKVELRRIDGQTGEMRSVLYKRDTSSLDSLTLYGLLTQDTIDFAAKNGEAHHYDVFRKSLWGRDPVLIRIPAAVGDSIVQTASFAIDANWDTQRIYATVLAQRRDRRVEQAARSAALSEASAGMRPAIPATGNVICYPNPATSWLFLATPGYISIQIRDVQGRLLIDKVFVGSLGVDVSGLAPGMYVITAATATGKVCGRFVRQ